MSHSGRCSQVGREEEGDDDDIDKILSVSNLHRKVTQEMIHELFVQTGPIKKITYKGPNGQGHKGNCFVHFEHKTSVPYTIDVMKGTELFERRLKLQSLPGSGHQKIDHPDTPPPSFVPAYQQNPMPDFIPLERNNWSPQQQQKVAHRHRSRRNEWFDSPQLSEKYSEDEY